MDVIGVYHLEQMLYADLWYWAYMEYRILIIARFATVKSAGGYVKLEGALKERWEKCQSDFDMIRIVYIS